jgi:uncharacterized protein YjbJ (UPF0337 family)
MNRDELRERWDEFEDDARWIWAKLTEDDLQYVQGDAERLIERVQQRYQFDRFIAEDEVGRFLARYPGFTDVRREANRRHSSGISSGFG